MLLYTLCFGFIGAFWRAWFGGSFFKISRIWQIVVLTFIVAAMYYTVDRIPIETTDICYALWSYGWFMRFWNHTHGDYFFVNDTSKDEGRSKWVDWCLQKIYGKDNYYNFKGNVTGLLIGYSVPAILATIVVQPHWYFMLGGVVIAFIYGLMGKLFPTKPYTKYAEYLCGFFCFILYYLTMIP